MRRLILFRHAKAEPRAAGGEDIDRPLAPRGREDATRVAGLLAASGLVPDLALVSSALRTRQTWQCASAAFPSARVQVLATIYNATPEEIEEIAREAGGDADTVMVVGHNPGLQELGVNLLIEGGAPAFEIERLAAKFPTATAAALRIDAAGGGALDGLYDAREVAPGEPPASVAGEAR